MALLKYISWLIKSHKGKNREENAKTKSDLVPGSPGTRGPRSQDLESRDPKGPGTSPNIPVLENWKSPRTMETMALYT